MSSFSSISSSACAHCPSLPPPPSSIHILRIYTCHSCSNISAIPQPKYPLSAPYHYCLACAVCFEQNGSAYTLYSPNDQSYASNTGSESVQHEREHWVDLGDESGGDEGSISKNKDERHSDSGVGSPSHSDLGEYESNERVLGEYEDSFGNLSEDEGVSLEELIATWEWRKKDFTETGDKVKRYFLGMNEEEQKKCKKSEGLQLMDAAQLWDQLAPCRWCGIEGMSDEVVHHEQWCEYRPMELL